MVNSLQTEPVRDLLGRLFLAADDDHLHRPGITERYPGGVRHLDAREQADAYQELYIPVSPEKSRPAALRADPGGPPGDGGGVRHLVRHLDHPPGRRRARQRRRPAWSAPSSTPPRPLRPAPTSPKAGLSEWVTILEGDALDTLAAVAAPIGFVLLDGWKNLYLPSFCLLEPRLAAGALVLADNTVSLAHEMTDYLGYVRDPANGYLSIAFPESDGLEITCRA